jgi:hypothetical protein
MSEIELKKCVTLECGECECNLFKLQQNDRTVAECMKCHKRYTIKVAV